jgi:hypothetical protein
MERALHAKNCEMPNGLETNLSGGSEMEETPEESGPMVGVNVAQYKDPCKMHGAGKPARFLGFAADSIVYLLSISR